MSDTHNDICHEGIVKDHAGGRARVVINSQSACASCHAKGACSSLDHSEKIIDVVAGEPLAPGDKVRITAAARLGWKAILYAFLLPLIVFAGVLITLSAWDLSDAVAALGAFAALLPYGFILYRMRDKFAREFVFTAHKIINSEDRGEL